MCEQLHPSPTRPSARALTALFLVSFLARAVVVLGFSDNSTIGNWMDQGAGVALNMLGDRGYTYDYEWLSDRRSFRMPGLPLVLYAVWTVGGVDIAVAKLVLAAIAAAGCVAIALLGSRLYNPTAGLLAGYANALYPPLLFWSTVLGPESLVACFLAFAIYSLTAPESTRKYFWSGIAFACLLLTRPVFGPLALSVAVLPVLAAPGRVGVRRAAAFCTVVGLLMAPWVIRNHFLHHALLLTSTEGGLTWLECNNPVSFRELHGDWANGYARTQPQVRAAAEQLSEVDLDRFMYRLGWDNILADPQGFANSAAWRVAHLWRPTPKFGTGFYNWKHHAIMIASWLPVFLAGMLAMIRDRVWRDRRHWPILLTLFWLTVAAGLARTSLRYRTPVEPLFVVYAVSLLPAAVSWLKRFVPSISSRLVMAAPRSTATP